MDTAGLAILISAVGLVLLAASYRLKRQAAKRAELRERRQRPHLSLHLRDAATELVGDADYRIWRFSLLLTNRSDRENSVVRAECRIEYRNTGDHIYNVAIPVHTGQDGNVATIDELKLPTRLNGWEAKAGVLSFGAPESALAGHNIIGYLITIEDAHGEEYQVEAIVVMEVAGQDD